MAWHYASHDSRIARFEEYPGSPEARWQSGYAAACKAVDAGSIPTLASIFSSIPGPCPGGEIGRRKGLKIPRSYLLAGSSPAPGTN